MRILIVDDEPLARSRLARLCHEEADLDVVAEVESGAAAIDAIRAHRPDLVLLDVELRDMTGFDVLHSLDAGEEPLAIMVTAYPEHAVRAFETDAIDYLTKPVDVRRFGAAIDRARQRRSQGVGADLRGEIEAEVRAHLGDLRDLGGLRQLVGEKARRLYFIEADKVDYVESDGNYVTIHVGDERYISRNSVKHLARRFAPHGFLRIERSLLVNLRRVAFAERLGHGLFAFTLPNGRRLVSGTTYRRAILNEIRFGQLPNLRRSH